MRRWGWVSAALCAACFSDPPRLAGSGTASSGETEAGDGAPTSGSGVDSTGAAASTSDPTATAADTDSLPNCDPVPLGAPGPGPVDIVTVLDPDLGSAAQVAMLLEIELSDLEALTTLDVHLVVVHSEPSELRHPAVRLAQTMEGDVFAALDDTEAIFSDFLRPGARPHLLFATGDAAPELPGGPFAPGPFPLGLRHAHVNVNYGVDVAPCAFPMGLDWVPWATTTHGNLDTLCATGLAESVEALAHSNTQCGFALPPLPPLATETLRLSTAGDDVEFIGHGEPLDCEAEGFGFYRVAADPGIGLLCPLACREVLQIDPSEITLVFECEE